MLTDVQIAQSATPRPIAEIADRLGLSEQMLDMYGPNKAKISLGVLSGKAAKPTGKLILVTGITPTPAGEGKTTTTIGLGDALARLGRKAAIAVREPSLGPCFGMKGGATGGGYSQVIPMEDINLHFTGDFHAITTAHNLLAALLDNHLHHGNALNIDPFSIMLKRVMDMNDRSLRDIVAGLGGKTNGVPRETGFDITTASEVMALLCLSQSLDDLKARLGAIVVALDRQGKPITAADLKAAGSMAVVLKDAIKPNLVQTLEGTPAFVHGGPFGNIAHGCNSLLATKMALGLSDYVVTEAGFGSDLGAEKFFNIKCRVGGLVPDCAVVVATVRALKMHAGVPRSEFARPNADAVAEGVANLWKHCENVEAHGMHPVVAINQFPTDSDHELSELLRLVREKGYRAAVADHWARGGEGATELAEAVLEQLDEDGGAFHYLYELGQPLVSKVEAIAKAIYGADRVVLTLDAEKRFDMFEQLGFGRLPVCMAKTQHSLSDDAHVLGRPSGFRITVKDARISAGAGFVVVYTGTIMTMPGLPASPSAENINLEGGKITGLS